MGLQYVNEQKQISLEIKKTPIRLIFKAAWGLAKIAAIILIVAAFPRLIGVLMIAGGIALLIPVALIGVAFGILKGCI